MVRFCLKNVFGGLFDSVASGAKVVVFRPSSGSGRRILFLRRLNMSSLYNQPTINLTSLSHIMPVS